MKSSLKLTIDSSGGSSGGTRPLFYIDQEGEGWSTIEEEVRQQEEDVARLNESLKSELEEKEASNAQYRKMMVSQQQ